MIRLGYDDLPTSAIRGTLSGPSELQQPSEHTAVLDDSSSGILSNSCDATPTVGPLEATSHSTKEIQELPAKRVARESQSPSFTQSAKKSFPDRLGSGPNPQDELATKAPELSTTDGPPQLPSTRLSPLATPMATASSSQQQDKQKKETTQGDIDDGWEESLGDKRLNEAEREAALARDPFSASFGPHSVVCAKCGVTIQLNQKEERRYYLSLWKRHRRMHLRNGDRLYD
ncbi:hypothetical protein P691DRAFT_780825 [Macrolepiota fuliginosa MF-IS2]|uniref:Uncharacterized protein n=1 Tax=Macrolepiota fuliginosa MF-IS2 TaxID=1400762 RepID=A0A9P5XDX2_9AGAR|nr:hypothetical protein P691DRAFT_780825 [Macrolepiota fuliginosa MF-IS2]